MRYFQSPKTFCLSSDEGCLYALAIYLKFYDNIILNLSVFVLIKCVSKEIWIRSLTFLVGSCKVGQVIWVNKIVASFLRQFLITESKQELNSNKPNIFVFNSPVKHHSHPQSRTILTQTMSMAVPEKCESN